MTEQPDRGGAFDFGGRLRPEYAPHHDTEPDPGEVVWVWVPYAEDHRVGKDRPVVVIGRDEDDQRVLVGLMLSSKDHDGDREWLALGAGAWDADHRPSWVRLDRPLGMHASAVRREGSALPQDRFLAVVEAAAALHRAGGRRTTSPRPAAAQSTPLRGLWGRLSRMLGRR